MSNVNGQAFTHHKHVEPIFHPQMRRTREVIRRPEWVKRTGEGVAHRGSLGSVALFGLLFANCVGGGYGFEDGIGAAGPLITLIVCIVLPWIWSFPTGLAVAELSTAVPSNSGVLMWANAAFPPFISFMCILATIFITFIGNATYPNLTSEYVGNLTELNKGTESAVKIAVIVVCCVLNCVGVEIVGSSSIILCAITILPFVLLTLIQLFGRGFNKAVLYIGPNDGGVKAVDWAGFFSIISWNYANIENAGAVVEEVTNPRKTLPRAMMLLMIGTYVGYVMPMLAGVSNQGVGQDYSQWKAGHWPEVANDVAGPWLKYMLFAGAILSGVGFTLTSMCCTSRLLAGMGTMEMFPKKISRVIGYYHPRLGTPIPALVLNSCVTIVFSCTLNFENVVSLCQSLYCLRLLVIYAAVVKLRIQYPKLPRPYALPCGTWAAAACLAPAAVFSLMAAIVSAMTNAAIGYALVGFVVGGSGISWVYCRVFARNGFQGVIVQCEVSEDDEENTGAGDSDGEGVLDEGVFYHDGEDDQPRDLLLGILPLSLENNTDSSVVFGTLPIGAGMGGDGAVAGGEASGNGSSTTSGEDFVAREDGASFGGTVENLPGVRRRQGHADSDDDIDIPLYPLRDAKDSTISTTVVIPAPGGGTADAAAVETADVIITIGGRSSSTAAAGGDVGGRVSPMHGRVAGAGTRKRSNSEIRRRNERQASPPHDPDKEE